MTGTLADRALPAPPSTLVVDAAESAALERATIDAGTPARALMQRAGAAAAAFLAEHAAEAVGRGVLVFAGTGNNGGDAWVAAAALARAGARVEVCAVGEARGDDPRTADARFERQRAEVRVVAPSDAASAGLVIDGVLGTGARGAPRGAAADAIARMTALRRAGAVVAALDLPSGVDASSGAADGALRADLTVTFGAMKRGLLVARGHAGRVAVLDIGLDAPRDGDSLGSVPRLVDARWVRAAVPPLPAAAHKGTRGRVAIVGGGAGMAGAAAFAARAAAASGAGVVKLVVAPASVAAAQAVSPHSLAEPWPADDAAAARLGEWATVLLVGPGLGNSAATRALVERLLGAWRGPTVLDADALNVFAGDPDALARLLAGRPAVITPHVAEFARLAGGTVGDALANPFDAALPLAQRLGCTVLLKGVPTVITDADGVRLVSATGTPALGAGGSGDVLGGVIATLLGQVGDAPIAAAAGAWTHGRAAEIAGAARPLRGVTLDHVLDALALAWTPPLPPPRPPVTCELPAVGEEARPCA